MKGANGFVQACNAQVAVEPNFQLIVGQLVTQDANDKQQMQPVVEAIREQSGQKPAEVVSLPWAWHGSIAVRWGKEENCQVAVSLSISGRQACRSPGDCIYWKYG